MTFSSTRQPDDEDRRPRGKSKATLMLDAIRDETGGDELQFFRKILRIGLGTDGGDNAQPVPMLLSEAMKRVQPPLKPSGEKININMPEGATHAQKCEVVFAACVSGDISAEHGQMLISMIKDSIAISESTELLKRLEDLEAAINAKANK